MKNLKPFVQTMLLTTLLTFVMIGCSRDNNIEESYNDGYFMKFKVNGVLQEYRNEAFEFKLAGNFNVTSSNSGFTSGASGSKEESESEKNAMLILITNENEIVTNIVYTNRASAAPNIEPTLFFISFFDSNGTNFITVNEESLTTLYQGIADAELTFTEVNPTTVRGNFVGSLYNSDGNISITEGEFYVPRTD